MLEGNAKPRSPYGATTVSASQDHQKNPSESEDRDRALLLEKLVTERSVDRRVADAFTKKSVFPSYRQGRIFVEELVLRLQKMHFSHYGYAIQRSVLARVLELCLERLSRKRTELSDKQLSHFLQFARNQIAIDTINNADPGTPGEREHVLKPFFDVIACEEDPVTRERLTFICRLFVWHGLRLSRNDVIETCALEENLFPTKRAIEDAVDTLRGAYEALRFLNGDLFVAPEYLADQTE